MTPGTLSSPLFRRLFLSYLLVLGAAAGFIGMVGASRVQRAYLDAREQSLREEAAMLAALLGDLGAPERAAGLGTTLRQLGEQLGCRITVVAEDGHVIADTMADATRMDDHSRRPEIVAAREHGVGSQVRESSTMHESMLYLAHRVAGTDGMPSYLRLAVPLADVHEHVRALYSGLAAATAAALALGGAVCAWLAGRRARPVLELARVADALAAGDLTRRSTLISSEEVGGLARALNAMAEALQARVATAARDREKLGAILASMSEGVIATDPQRRIIHCNAAAGTLLGFSHDRALDRPLWEVVREDAVLRAASAALEEGRPSAAQAGPIAGRWLELMAAPLPDSSGVVLVLHDATEAVRYQELRKEFVANVSHELRTPLTFIRGFVETLRDGALHDPEKGPEYLAIIEKHVHQLSNLVADLLELSRLESRPGLPRSLRVDPAELLARVVEGYRPAAEKKRQSLTLATSPGLPALVGDPDYLERALGNLIDNAIKYTPERGTIRVGASIRDGRLAIEVADDGIGIPPQDMPRIFERFYRVEKSRSRDMGGTGLGLSIVKHVAQAHGGSVTAESEPGKGTVMRLMLPLGAE